MDNYSLNRNEIIKLIEYKIDKQEIEDDLKQIFERSEFYWDIKLISSNCVFSIVLEQYIRKNMNSAALLDNYYRLKKEIFILIEELNSDFIDYMYNNKMPNRRNSDIADLIEAQKNNNQSQVEFIKEKLSNSFEEDLITSIQDYHDKIYG